MSPDSSHSSQHVVTVPAAAHTINLIAIPVALATAYMTLADIDSPIRLWFAVFVFMLGAGSGLTQFLRIPDAALQVGVVIGLSLAIDVLVAQSLLSIHNVSEKAGVCLLAGITCIRPIFHGKNFVEDISPQDEQKYGEDET